MIWRQATRLLQLICTLNALLVGGYALYLYEHWLTLYRNAPLLVLGGAIYLGASCWYLWLAYTAPEKLPIWKARPRWQVVLGILVLWWGVLQFGSASGSLKTHIWELVILYGWFILLGILWLWHPIPPQPVDPSLTFASNAALFFGTLAFLKNTLLLWAFSFSFIYDSPSYLYTWHSFWNADSQSALRRSVPYPLLNILLDSINHPQRIIWLQILINALAVAALVYVVARSHKTLALCMGLLLALDLSAGLGTRALLTESLYTSLHLLGLAWFISHTQRQEMLKPAELLAAGIFYGCTLILRPSGLGLIAPLLLGYLVLTRSWVKTGWVLLGNLLLIGSIALFNYARVGQFGISGNTGIYVAFPLFYHDYFSPENGAASEELAAKLIECYGDYRTQIPVTQLNYYLHTLYRQCLQRSGDTAYETTLYARAYREALLAQPQRFIKTVLVETGKMVDFPVQATLNNISPFVFCREIDPTLNYRWCDELPTAFRLPPERFIKVAQLLSYPTQLYLTPIPPPQSKMPLSTFFPTTKTPPPFRII